MRKLAFFFVFAVLSVPVSLLAQGSFIPPQTAFKNINGIVMPIANATITVCAASAGGVPCSPALTNTIFSDGALTQSLPNPFTSDANGNYQFAAASGTYTVTVAAADFAGYSYQVSVAPGGISPTNGANTALSNLGATAINAPLNFQNPTISSAYGFQPDPFGPYLFPVGSGIDQLADCAGVPCWNPSGSGAPNEFLYTTSIVGTLNPSFLGPICIVGGVGAMDTPVYTSWAGCINQFNAEGLRGGTINDWTGVEDIAINPFRLNMATQLNISQGIPALPNFFGCNNLFPTCIIAEVPLILPYGTRIKGSGIVQQFADPSQGTAITYGTNFPAPLGPPNAPSVSCASTGGGVAAGTYYVVTSLANNLQTNPSYTQAQGVPGIGLHSPESSVTCGGSGAALITVTSPTIPTWIGAQPFPPTEYYIYLAQQYTGTVTTTTGASSGCPQNCVVVTGGTQFGQGEDIFLSRGAPIVINSVTYHIYQIFSHTVLQVMETIQSPNSGYTYTTSLGNYQQVITNINSNSCAASGNGVMDQTDCLLGDATKIASTSGLGEMPPDVDLSNPLIVCGDRNGGTIEFACSIENVNFDLTNGASAGTVVPTQNAPAVVFLNNSSQEEGYLSQASISGASQQAYGVFSNDGPNYAFRDTITGGGPSGYTGTISCNTANPAVCTLQSGNYFGPWYGDTINIAGAGSCPTTNICVVASVSNGGQTMTLTTAASGSTLTNVNYCMGSGMNSADGLPSAANCTGTTGTLNTYGNFIDYILDASTNPNARANGTLRKFDNISVSSKGGVGVYSEVLVRGFKAVPTFIASHFELNPTTGNDCITVTAGASAIVIGDKDECPVAILHMTATAAPGSGQVSALNTVSFPILQCDNIAAGTGNYGTGNNSYAVNPGGNVFASGKCADNIGNLIVNTLTAGTGPGQLTITTGAFSRLASCGSASAPEGTMAAVTDSTTATWGGTISGSSTNHVMAYCDGTNWTVMGK